MEFSKVLKETRERMGLTQTELAKRLEVARSSLSFYESGKQIPDIKFLDSLHKISGAPLDYLMGYTDNYTQETAGLDKKIGLSTTSINVLANCNKLWKTIINCLLESPHLSEWIDLAADVNYLIYYKERTTADEELIKEVDHILTGIEVKIGKLTADIMGTIDNGLPYHFNRDLIINAEMKSLIRVFMQAENSEAIEVLKKVMPFSNALREAFQEMFPNKNEGESSHAEKETFSE